MAKVETNLKAGETSRSCSPYPRLRQAPHLIQRWFCLSLRTNSSPSTRSWSRSWTSLTGFILWYNFLQNKSKEHWASPLVRLSLQCYWSTKPGLPSNEQSEASHQQRRFLWMTSYVHSGGERCIKDACTSLSTTSASTQGFSTTRSLSPFHSRYDLGKHGYLHKHPTTAMTASSNWNWSNTFFKDWKDPLDASVVAGTQ